MDTECLRPYSALLAQYNTTSSSLSDTISTPSAPHPSTRNVTPSPIPTLSSIFTGSDTAFLARMGTDNTKKYSIPNAWMASTPSHPFWLLPLDLVASGLKPYGEWPEAVTGPDALFYLVNDYMRDYSNNAVAEAELDDYLRSSEMSELYLRSLNKRGFRAGAGAPKHQLKLLNHQAIFPYWWGEKELGIVCKAGVEEFDPETCKDVLDVQALGSWSITYWSHSWSEEGGHDTGHLNAMEEAKK